MGTPALSQMYIENEKEAYNYKIDLVQGADPLSAAFVSKSYDIIFFPKYPEISLQGLFGYLGYPFAFLMGIPASECGSVGYVLGCKVVLNEIVAYKELLNIQSVLSPRSFRIATFACCGFANFGTLSILYGLIAPLLDDSRIASFSKLLLKALLAAVLASFTTAALIALVGA